MGVEVLGSGALASVELQAAVVGMSNSSSNRRKFILVN